MTQSHSTSLVESARFARLLQPVRCTVTPLEWVIYPTITSPGRGAQHFAIFTAMPVAPSTRIPASLTLSRLFWMGTALDRTVSSFASIKFARRLFSRSWDRVPAPKAANISSNDT